MQNLNKRERLLLFVCVVVVLYGGWLLLHPAGPPTGQRALLSPQEARQKTEVANRTLKRIETEQKEMEPRILHASYNLPPEELVPRVIGDLQKIADKAGVHLREIKPLHPRELDKADGARVSLEARFSAKFQPQVIRFLYYIEDPAGKMVLDKLNVTSTETRLKTVDVTAQISVFTRRAAEVVSPQGDKKNGNTTAKQGG